MNVISLVIAFAAGAAVEFLNYLITRAALAKPNGMSAIFSLRALIAAAFLAALYFASKALGLDVTACMIAGAAGASVGLAAFTALLMKYNRKGGGSDG